MKRVKTPRMVTFLNDAKTMEDNIIKIYYTVGELAELCSVSRWKLIQICKDYNITTRRVRESARNGSEGNRIFTKEQAEYILEISRWEKKSRAELITAIITTRPNFLNVA